MQIALFYGTDTDNTKRIAETIQSWLGEEIVALHNLAEVQIQALLPEYDFYIFGAPTWYDGELQTDWEDVVPLLRRADLRGKNFAVFGLGDQQGYGEWFVDAIGIIAEAAEAAGAKLSGTWPLEGYDFDESKAVRDGQFLGLPLDEDNQPELTEERLEAWLPQVLEGFGFAVEAE